MLTQVFLQKLVDDSPAPELIFFGLIFRPWRFLPAKLNRCIRFEINGLLQQVLNFRDPVVNAFRVKIVNLISRLECAEENIAGHRVAILRDHFINIFLSEKKMTVVEHLEIGLKEFPRYFFVQSLMRVVAFLQKPPDRHRDRFF